MLPGPVFSFELLATARRSRFYLVRAFYASILFAILWGIHSAWTSETGGELASRMVKWFAFSTFCGITIGQEILVLILTPALVAAVIADERQRKTLHYLHGQPADQFRDRAGQAARADALRHGSSGRQPAGVEPAGAPGGDRPEVGLDGVRRNVEHGVVTGVAFDLGVDDRASRPRGVLHFIRA